MSKVLAPGPGDADTRSVAPVLPLSGKRRRPRLRDESGFSLMELVVVLMIVGILVTIGSGLYIGMRDEGNTTAAELHVRQALNAVHSYYGEHETFAGMSRASLAGIDAGVRLSREPVISADGKRYCVESTHNGNSPTAPSEPGVNPHSYVGPGGEISLGLCPASL
jgi:prepilin-type N-terminal cleavage/methylation domain-containing protein